jgi:hypothetical protein
VVFSCQIAAVASWMVKYTFDGGVDRESGSGPLSHRHISLALIRQEFDSCHTQPRHLLWTSTSTTPNHDDRTNQHQPPLPPVAKCSHQHTHTHTHKGPTSSRKTTEVLPPRHEVLLTSTRKNPLPNTPTNIQSKPQTPD